MNWIKFADKLPTEKPGEQVKILFYTPGWATCFVGMFINDPQPISPPAPLGIFEYSFEHDRYFAWDKMPPSHYCVIDLPEPNKAHSET